MTPHGQGLWGLGVDSLSGGPHEPRVRTCTESRVLRTQGKNSLDSVHGTLSDSSSCAREGTHHVHCLEDTHDMGSPPSPLPGLLLHSLSVVSSVHTHEQPETPTQTNRKSNDHISRLVVRVRWVHPPATSSGGANICAQVRGNPCAATPARSPFSTVTPAHSMLGIPSLIGNFFDLLMRDMRMGTPNVLAGYERVARDGIVRWTSGDLGGGWHRPRNTKRGDLGGRQLRTSLGR